MSFPRVSKTLERLPEALSVGHEPILTASAEINSQGIVVISLFTTLGSLSDDGKILRFMAREIRFKKQHKPIRDQIVKFLGTVNTA